MKFMQMTHYQFQLKIKTNIPKESQSCILLLGAVLGNCKINLAYYGDSRGSESVRPTSDAKFLVKH
jgi:hypothetical protein